MRATTARSAGAKSDPLAHREPTIAVIGGGFSGTLLALHLLRRCPPAVRIHLVEQSPSFGRGVAYSTGNLNHVLNVPTARMSAFHDRPNDFLDWLRQSGDPCGASVTANCFVAHKTFGDYVRHHLKEELRQRAGDGKRLVLTRGRVLDLRIDRGGIASQIDRGRRIEADIVVLAVGNFPPEAPPIADRRFYDSERYRADPWAPDALSDLDPAAPVLLIGTGLTTVDTTISLLDRGHKGAIHALSRRGLLPRRHSTTPLPTHSLIDRALPSTAAGLTRMLREAIADASAKGGDWRSVIDGLRPITQDTWQTASAEERARFLRHLRPWWDVHRHRLAPVIADRIERAIAAGQLQTGATRIRAIRGIGEAVEITHRPRRSSADQNLFVQRVINCAGPACDYARIDDPLIRALLNRGDIRPDPLRLGLDVTSLCALRNRRGEIWQRLYAVGPVTRAAFWEVTSVPDIRRQCETLAQHFSARIAASVPAPPSGQAIVLPQSAAQVSAHQHWAAA
jgi:uncharacterized NAD(P)/FAD-binding protein YdhS